MAKNCPTTLTILLYAIIWLIPQPFLVNSFTRITWQTNLKIP